MLTKCPICGSDVNYSYKYSYYLRCKRSYNCWHMPCDKNTAEQYPEYISSNEESLAFDMREKILNNEQDYYHDD